MAKMAVSGKKGIFINLTILLVWTTVTSCQGNKEELCIAEDFQAACNPNEVIIMESAVYGRMKLGRCIDRDYGHLGCSNDALDTFDMACSAKQSCKVEISDKLRKDVAGACGAFLVGYAEVIYNCKKVHPVNTGHCQGEEILLTEEKTVISSSTIKGQCNAIDRFTLAVNPGQTMNISLWNFNKGHRRAFGVVQDKVSGNTEELSGAFRFQDIITSVGNVVEVDFHRFQMEDAHFLIDIKVIGCADMSPPEGAWMSRDGDVIEIGCHAGAKSWSMHCENNQWVGVLGYCGGIQEDTKSKRKMIRGKSGAWSVSPNILVFGVSSLIILLSACIFLAGVIVLKRKLTTKNERKAEHTMTLLPRSQFNNDPEGTLALTKDSFTASMLNQHNMVRAGQNTITSSNGGYKSLQMPWVGTVSRNDVGGADFKLKTVHDYSQYINSTKSDVSEDSVKYFALEDSAREQVRI